MSDVIDQSRFRDNCFGDEDRVLDMSAKDFLLREAGRLPEDAHELAVAGGERQNGKGFAGKMSLSLLQYRKILTFHTAKHEADK